MGPHVQLAKQMWLTKTHLHSVWSIYLTTKSKEAIKHAIFSELYIAMLKQAFSVLLEGNALLRK